MGVTDVTPGVSRKRPAPGASPAMHPSMAPISNYSPNQGPQLSNDQFLQWGQSASPTAVNPSVFPDMNSYNAGYLSPQDGAATPTTQLTRRPMSQIVSRTRSYDQSQSPMIDHNGNHVTDAGGWGESLPELQQRALIAKREAQAKRKQIPPFVQKLSSFLDESKNTDLIRWSDDGNSFIVLDEDEFAKTLIPELFKHNNYASFVRQLNMYGFHKKVGLSDNSMRASERKNKSPSEYSNPYFKRGHPDLLWLIQKPKNVPGQGGKSGKGNARMKAEDGDENEGEEYGEDGAPGQNDRSRARGQLSLTGAGYLQKEQLSGVYRELQAIRQQQQIISSTINKLRREHEQLYAQAATFQEQHTRHENSINAILTFLATVYNRSLQDGSQSIANSFVGAIPQDQGNVVDVGDDYSLSNFNGDITGPDGQRSAKRQPLLLKAPPVAPDRQSRAHTLSPSSTHATFEPPRRPSHVRQGSVPQSGHVEEVFDTNSPQQRGSPHSQNSSQRFPQGDIMSVIQNSNARHGMPATSMVDFPTVLSSLESSGGNSPLTPKQRADMLRLMMNETNSADPAVTASSNNALITPTPPPMPQNYANHLASTRAEIDNLTKMQAEQDRSVQNLTNLLQPLSPNGSIPGVGEHANGMQPSLDLDQIFNSDYFSEMPDIEKTGIDFPESTAPPAQTIPTSADPASDLFSFDNLPSGADPELFDDATGISSHDSHSTPSGYYDGYQDFNKVTGLNGHTGGTPSGFAAGRRNVNESGRVVETFTDSESTSPAGAGDDNSQFSARNLPDSGGGKGNGGGGKRRRKA
ncbi:heat shock transcription factor [Paecilomyces variotii No. 5]|uniref:Heat shock transcription factor n=1 Tax=Byssochlamys spectabilis (strain No. 5 / NBRC 109023) TaxID=1356009 RepID=V5HRU1_BYSSN|nr:heat shock transcription factor [Paecilomyces variotii No. 5]